MDPLSFIFILKTAAQRSPPWLVKTKKMLDLHYTRTIVLNVEVENWKSHRKENPCTTTPRHSALSSGVFPRLAVVAFSSLQKLNVLGADGLMFS